MVPTPLQEVEESIDTLGFDGSGSFGPPLVTPIAVEIEGKRKEVFLVQILFLSVKQLTYTKKEMVENM